MADVDATPSSMKDEDTHQTDVLDQSTAPRGPYIPVWVALAGMLAGVIVALLIVLNALDPLLSLVFPSEPTLPLPEDAVELEYIENSRTSDEEWVYETQIGGCGLVNFFISEHDAQCTIAPFVCEGNPIDGYERRFADRITNIATCRGGTADSVNSYSWEVYISSGYPGDYLSQFRLYLYTGR